MESMFYYCSSLTSLDLSNFDTSNVTNMSYMFDGCRSLTSLDLSSFDTKQVTNIGSMFYHCSSLTSLDLSNFDTSNVTNMSYMFDGCRSLTSLNISNFTFNDTLKGTTNIFYSMPTTAQVIVNTESEQTWILGLSSSDRPSAWSTDNVITKDQVTA